MSKLKIPIVHPVEGVTGECSEFALPHWLSQGWLIEEGWTYPVPRDEVTGEPLGEPVPLDRATGKPLGEWTAVVESEEELADADPEDLDDLADVEE